MALSFIKKFLDKSFSQNDNKAFTNSLWLICEKIFTLLSGALITAILARYFGPENYGIFNFSLSFVTLFSILSNLGLETLTVKEIITKNFKLNVIFWSTFTLRLFGGLLILFFSLFFGFLFNFDPVTISLINIFGITFVFRAFEVGDYFVQAFQKGKYSSLIRILTFSLLLFSKIFLIIFDGSIIHLSFIQALHVLITSLFIVFFFPKGLFKIENFEFDFEYIKHILNKSKFLIFSGLMVTLYGQIDKILLSFLSNGNFEIGIYSASQQLSTLWYFIPMSIIVSYKPDIIESRKKGQFFFEKSIQKLYTIIIFISLAFSIFISIFSKDITVIIFGMSFIQSSSILTINIFSGIFLLSSLVTSIWLVSENLQNQTAYFTLIGLIISLVMNFFLIPSFGGVGAAISSLVTNFFVAFVIPSFSNKTRKISIFFINGFLGRGIL